MKHMPPPSPPSLLAARRARSGRPGRHRGHHRAAIQGPQSGRILVFAHRVEPGAAADHRGRLLPVRADRHRGRRPRGRGAAPPAVPRSSMARPTPSRRPSRQLPPGTYRFQAVLDRNHDYNYGGRGAGRHRLAGGRGPPSRPGAAPRPHQDRAGARSCAAAPWRASRQRRDAPPGTMPSPIDFVSPRSPPSGAGRSICAAGSRCRPAIGRTAPRFPVVYYDPRLRRRTSLMPAQRGRDGRRSRWPPATSRR